MKKPPPNVRVCTNDDVKENYEEPPKRRNRWGVRTAVITAYDAYQFPNAQFGPLRHARNLGFLLRYAIDLGRTTWGKVVPMDVAKLVDSWIEVIVGMSLAHDKDEFDAHDARADEILHPLFKAPIKQVREFYFALLERMKADKRVPMIVWMGYEAWGEIYVKDAPDEGVKRLKNKLAGEIAALTTAGIRDQIPEAIKRALRWRDPETLKEVKAELEKGAKPKLKGRQSCLFLHVGKATVML